MTGLGGWWPLHENSGSTARDLSGNGNHGSLKGGITQGVAGKSGLTAYSCNGSDSYIDVGEKSVLRPEKFTLSARVRFSSVGSNYQLVVDQDEEIGKGGYRIILNSDATLSFSVNDSGTSYSIKSETIDPNRWYHLLMKFDGSSLIAYIDGQKVDSKSATLSYPNSEPFVIAGRHKNGSYDLPLNGKINDVRLYNRVLSPKEIKTLYEWGSGDYTRRSLHDGTDSGAVSRWKFESGAVTADSWGSNTLTDKTSDGTTTDGIRGDAKSFDGSDDYMTAGSVGDYTDNFSIFAWVKGTGADRIVTRRDGSTTQYDFFINDGGSGELSLWDGSNTYNTLPIGGFDSGDWHHVGFAIDSGVLKFYGNGRLMSTHSSVSISSITKDTEIGSNNNGSNGHFGGDMDDVRIYSRALEPHEVFQLYQWGTKGRDMRKLTVNQR
jgi:hypothetical protein